MSEVKEKVERSLDALEAVQALLRIVNDVLEDYPDPFVLATKEAERILLKHTGKSMDPRFIWWHQFDSGSSSGRSFNGWKHRGAPSKSMRLTELVIQRFDVYFQEASDELDQRGGFYRQGPYARAFDERNEVPMLGRDVQTDLWALDFAEFYRAKVTRFWQAHGQNFRVLGKINLVAQANAALRAGRITAADNIQVRAMVSAGLMEGQIPTLALLQQGGSGAASTVTRYELGQAGRGSFYSWQETSGRVVLYLPWATDALRGFDSSLQMAAWLRTQLQDVRSLNAFVSASLSDPRDAAHADSVRLKLHSLAASRSNEAALALLGFMHAPLVNDLFDTLIDQARREMQATTESLLSNSDLRKAMWSGYLSAFLRVFGGIAPFGWPMSLMLLGASVAKVGLDIDAALHAKQDQTRKAALREAIVDTLFAALNMVDVSFQSSVGTLAYQAPFPEGGVSLSGWEAHPAANEVLEGQASNEVIQGELITTGRLRGLHVANNGTCWVVISGVTYRVRYSQDLSVWLIVPPDDPFSFGPLRPVRLNEAGEWELLEPPASSIAAPTAVSGMSTEPSLFWEEYIGNDVNRRQALSARARGRQKALLKNWGLPVLGRDMSPGADEEGLYCVEVDGVRSYSYLHEGDGYHNELIEFYTDEDSQVNKVLRAGIYDHDDTDSYISKLADTLESLPKSNAVTLYRGGHGGRGTSGMHFRSGRLNVGDVLVNTDLTSFTENPYIAPEFAGTFSREGEQLWNFDDTSVVFELPAGHYQSGTPISAFSMYWDEAETLFLPGHYFRIDKLKQVYGRDFHFIQVSLSQTIKPASGPVYDLRTGEVFDLPTFLSRIRTQALVERFFPSAQ